LTIFIVPPEKGVKELTGLGNTFQNKLTQIKDTKKLISSLNPLVSNSATPVIALNEFVVAKRTSANRHYRPIGDHHGNFNEGKFLCLCRLRWIAEMAIGSGN
jgi:hypothetical protein